MEDFATYILEEENLSQKMLITYYLSKKTGIFFDKSIVLKAEIAKMFIEYMQINVDKNLVLTAMLLCNCKKIENAQKIGKLETFAKDGAEYLSTLGFSKRFCKICEEVNRYSESSPRERESDILENSRPIYRTNTKQGWKRCIFNRRSISCIKRKKPKICW